MRSASRADMAKKSASKRSMSSRTGRARTKSGSARSFWAIPDCRSAATEGRLRQSRPVTRFCQKRASVVAPGTRRAMPTTAIGAVSGLSPVILGMSCVVLRSVMDDEGNRGAASEAHSIAGPTAPIAQCNPPAARSTCGRGPCNARRQRSTTGPTIERASSPRKWAGPIAGGRPIGWLSAALDAARSRPAHGGSAVPGHGDHDAPNRRELQPIACRQRPSRTGAGNLAAGPQPNAPQRGGLPSPGTGSRISKLTPASANIAIELLTSSAQRSLNADSGLALTTRTTPA